MAVRMNNGREMPIIGFGTAGSLDVGATKAAVVDAIKAGYRHFDTAFSYGSEKALGEAVVEALRDGLVKSRDELFITTKLWGTFSQRHLVVPAIRMSLENLKMEYVDLYLVHFPVKLNRAARAPPFPEEYVEALDVKSVWEGMEECHSLGLAKSIGVSNFSVHNLKQTLQFATIPPAVNQVEMNPMWQQKELREFCNVEGIHVTAYSVLGANNTKWGDNRILGSSVIQEIARAKGKTVAQVALRWVYEQGVSLVVKSFSKARMEENLEIFDWSLTHEDRDKMLQLPQRKGVLISQIMGPHKILLEIDQGVEVNPMWQQNELREFCKQKGIHITAYFPLGANNTKWGDNRILSSNVLQEIAQAKGKTVAQVALRWVHEQGVSLVVKSYKKPRMEENLQIFDWSLTNEELQKISMLPQRKGALVFPSLGTHKLLLEIDQGV